VAPFAVGPAGGMLAMHRRFVSVVSGVGVYRRRASRDMDVACEHHGRLLASLRR